MKPCKSFLVFFLLLLVLKSNSVFSQKLVNVDLFTGTANITIPVYTIQRGDITVPIVYYYRASGIKVEDYDQRFGLGWKLSLDAGITRNLRGFPDDISYQANTGYPAVKGWLMSGVTDIPGKVENFSIAGGITSGSCTNEVTDYSYMNSNIAYNYDSEPDIFDVNAPGLNLQFVFDKTGTIKTIPYQDVKITKTVDQYGAITSFTVVRANGVKYIFDKKNLCTITVDYGVNTSTLPAFSRDYLFYKTYSTNDNSFSFTSKWCLTSITDTKLTIVSYTYDVKQPGSSPVANEKVEILKYNPSTQQYDKTYLYTTSKYIEVERLNRITAYNPDGVAGANGDIQFTWDADFAESKLTEIKMVKEGKKITPVYTGKFCGNGNLGYWGRYFLKSLDISGNGVTPQTQYKFLYSNVNDDTHESYCTFSGNDSITNDQDYWGYFNGHPVSSANTKLDPQIWYYAGLSSGRSFKIHPIPGNSNGVLLAGVNRDVHTNAVAGTLTQITYPTGGTTTLSYDNQVYFDSDVNDSVWGGGVRTRSITDNDGISGTNEVTYYDYDDPSTNITTGRATTVPTFAFAIPNSNSFSTLADKVKNSSYRTLYNLSNEDAYVVYSKVTVRKTNGGKSLYEFNSEGVWGASNGNDWTETMVYGTRNYTSAPGTCNNVAPDILQNDKYDYPFAANTHFDFQRGLLNKVTNYNAGGNMVSEETYTYQRSHTTSSSPNPMAVVWALKYDDITGGSFRRYARYNVLGGVTNLLATKTTKIYSTSNYTNYTTETETYSYPTGDHRLPVTITKTNSDGTSYKTYVKYVKDYGSLSSGGDTYNAALYAMQGLNINAMVESYQSVTVPGSSEVVVGASLVLPKTYYNNQSGFNMYLPYEIWKFVSQAGVAVSNFPSAITSGNFQKYSGYLKTATINDYDFGGLPVSVTGASSRINSCAIYDIDNGGLKVAEFQNAKNTEILYSSFDYDNLYANFGGYTSGDLFAGGRKSKSCLSMTTSTSIYHSVSNATTNSDMIFSCWIKGDFVSGNVTVNLSASGLNSNYNLSFTGITDWTYYEIRIPKPSNSSYTVTLTTSTPIKIDDILFYPGNASAKTYSYDEKLFMNSSSYGLSAIVLTAETGMSGSTRSYEYDLYGRPQLVRDGFNNIVETKSYKPVNNWPSFSATPSIAWAATVPQNVLTTFVVSWSSPLSLPAEIISYTWDFGDGTAASTSSVPYQLHRYRNLGTYQVTCTIYSPAIGTWVVQTPVTSSTNPLPVTVIAQDVTPLICSAGVSEETADGQCIQASCSGLTSACTYTKFQLTAIGNGSLANVQTQVWEKAPVGSTTWTTVSAPLGIATVNFSTSFPWTASYRMRCRVTMTNGDTGTSAEIYVYNNYNQ